jgi:hypothetical protein
LTLGLPSRSPPTQEPKRRTPEIRIERFWIELLDGIDQFSPPG